jgi:glycosyltransferase involved in cell wall biosynthesis
MKIAIVVHGRWDAFDLARELNQRGHAVRLLTNYPRWAVTRWGVRPASVRGFWQHGVLARVVERFGGRTVARRAEPVLHQMFGRWAASTLRREGWDVVYAFSGVAEESLLQLAGRARLRLLVRESAHIRAQDRLLRDEEGRTGAPQDRPSPWMIGREEREYAQADAIRVLSSFSRQSFIDEGVPPHKVRLVLSGVHLSTFRASDAIVEERCARILSGAPLRVLNVGTFAFRKGVWDTAAIIRELGTSRCEYRFVGPIAPEAMPIAAGLRHVAEFTPKQPQNELPSAYAWGDIFMLPAIEDGFAAVLAQAAAAALPILTTPNGAGSDLVHEGETGWILPIRSPDAFVERLRWADTHRAELADMVRDIHQRFRPRDFGQVAEDLERLCADLVGSNGVRV